MWLFGWKNNTVFHAGPSENMHWIDTNGSGSYSFAGKRASDPYAINGNAVMYAPGKILTLGGAATYSSGNARKTATVIDITGQAATARTVAPMAAARAFSSSTVLPNGEVLVTGGQAVVREFHDSNAVMTPEIWNPDTETFRPVASHAVPRTYHSMALLLPDARVIIGGGGLCGNCGFNHPDVEIYSPPYLFEPDGTQASRPAILSSPNSVDLNERFQVGTDRTVSEFALVRSGSATHAVNLDQRRIPLQSTALGNNNYRLTMPADGGIAIPGSYMLFGLDSQGVPSVAATVLVTTDVAPEPVDSIEGFVSQEDGTLRAGVQVDLFEQAPDGSRGTFLRSTTTDSQGRYSFDVEPGCYSLTFVAPDGETIEGQSWNTQGVCLDANGQSNEVNPVIDDPSTGGEPEVRGTVSFSDGSPAADVTVDLFAEGTNGQRGQFLGSTKTAADRSDGFTAEPNTCYILTMIAPSDAAFDSGQYFQPGTCVAESDSVVDATLTSSSNQAAIGGMVSTASGAAVPGAFVDLFKANADGSRGAFVGSTQTGSGGEYQFEAIPDCYILTFIAPGDETYNGSRWLQVPQCVDAGEVITNVDTSLD